MTEFVVLRCLIKAVILNCKFLLGFDAVLIVFASVFKKLSENLSFVVK